MKSFILASLVALASAASVSKVAPTFSLTGDRSTDGAPSVTITFADGYTDTLVFSRYYSNEENRMANVERCHYIGHLANELEACAAMTGCPGSEDIEFTIMSTHSADSMFKWNKEGEVEIIESPFKHASKSEMLSIRDDGDWVEDGDEEVNPELEAAEMAIEEMCSGTSCTSVPATNLLQIRAGYDDGFKNKVGGDAQARAYIEATMPHIQVSYCHASLGSKIVVQRIGDIKYYSGRSLQATEGKLKEMWSTTETDLGDADLMMYMGYDTSYYGTVGIAWGKVVCIHNSARKYKESINEWRKTHTEAAHVIAHEIGHNIGMDHDFTDAHKAAGCDGKGIMSYGNPPNEWSACSKADLQAHYLTQKNNWCMDPAPKACDGTTTDFTTTTTTTTPAAPLACYQGWVKDGYCDYQNNHAGCQFDGGDCCNQVRPDWDKYCGNECECKQSPGF